MIKVSMSDADAAAINRLFDQVQMSDKDWQAARRVTARIALELKKRRRRQREDRQFIL